MLSFSSMSNSLSHSAANTMRPTKVRAERGIEHVGVFGQADAQGLGLRAARERRAAPRPARRDSGAASFIGRTSSGVTGSARSRVTRRLGDVAAARGATNADCSRARRASTARGASAAREPPAAAISRQKWQATRVAVGVGLAAPASAREQSGRACGQRVWKRQPDGGAIGLGTSPASSTRSALQRRARARGIADSSACV